MDIKLALKDRIKAKEGTVAGGKDVSKQMQKLPLERVQTRGDGACRFDKELS